jgi:hypothetical protein
MDRRRALLASLSSFSTQPNDEIWYTSTDELIVDNGRTSSSYYGAKLISNTYVNGKGVMKFDGAVTKLEANTFVNLSTLKTIRL